MGFLCILQYNEIYKEVGVQVFDKLVLDFDPETKEELVAVDPYIVSKLKPHQVNYRHVFYFLREKYSLVMLTPLRLGESERL
jgi:hypothetical protein